jgi:2-polyprenyl-3-methyl-5-hydroxy-6-metoxy-1,4-benzoquinol methylase
MKKCLICENYLSEIKNFTKLHRVTSDCKPFKVGGKLFECRSCGLIQKTNDQKWKQEINYIYDNYEIYLLSNGMEQVIFTESGPVPRSKKIVETVLSEVFLPKKGRMIDVGCGNGSALKSFSSQMNNWTFDGFELSKKNLTNLEKIKNFSKLYISSLDEIDVKYDLVTAIHSLEHIENPVDFLNSIQNLLLPDGVLFIQVPNSVSSVFDVLVADHISHFTPSTLLKILEKTNYEIIFISDKVLTKEITVIARKKKNKANVKNSFNSIVSEKININSRIAWLNELVKSSNDMYEEGFKYGIFGSSISAMWLLGSTKNKVDFFVDEDLTKIGQNFMSIPIILPNEINQKSKVFVPMSHIVAKNIKSKLENSLCTYHIPENE